jgi:tetratricopeptide (TPR) repeat protein
MKRGISHVRPALPLLLGILFLPGCATLAEKSERVFAPILKGTQEKQSAFADLPERIRAKARDRDKGGDLPAALAAWTVLLALLPADPEASGRAVQLEKQLPAQAERHFQKGLEFYNARAPSPARKEFLSVLYLNPDHAGARYFLKNKLGGEDHLSYEVAKGDTLREVARKIYEDPEKDFLIAYFNGLKPDSGLSPSRILILPYLDSRHLPPRASPVKADGEGRTGEASEIRREPERTAGDSPAEKPEKGAAAAPPSGEDPSSREIPQGALSGYPAYMDAGIQDVREGRERAESHYISGVKFFAQDEIERAIVEWETALALQPDHPKAGKDIETARGLLQKLEKIK